MDIQMRPEDLSFSIGRITQFTMNANSLCPEVTIQLAPHEVPLVLAYLLKVSESKRAPASFEEFKLKYGPPSFEECVRRRLDEGLTFDQLTEKLKA
jgi:hypothetical protein